MAAPDASPKSPATPSPSKLKHQVSRRFTMIETREGDHFDDLEHQLEPSVYIKVVKEVPKLNVAVISSPESGHLIPMVQAAYGLAARKHSVQLITLAFAVPKIESQLRKAGVEPVGLAAGVQSAESGEGRAAELKAACPAMMAMFMYYEDELYPPAKEHIERLKPDVIVTDFITVSGMRIARELKIPLLVNFPAPLSLIPRDMATKYGPLMRLAYVFLPKADRQAAKRIFADIEYCCYNEICLFNSFFGLEKATEVPSNYFVTGPTAPRPPKEPRTTTSHEAMNKWLEGRQGEKVVYVTMGSMQVLTVKQLKDLYGGLNAVEGICVAWSLKEDQQALLPEGALANAKFFFHKWFPQNEVLQLSQVAAVVTHCGFGGTCETAIAGKPVVATPFRADQPENAEILRKAGCAEVLKVTKMTDKVVKLAVTKVVTDPKYKAKAEELQDAVRKTGGAERIAEVVEEVVQKKGLREIIPGPPSKLKPLEPVGIGCAAGWAIYGLKVFVVGLCA